MIQVSKLFPKQSLLHKCNFKMTYYTSISKNKRNINSKIVSSRNTCVGFVYVGRYMYVWVHIYAYSHVHKLDIYIGAKIK